MGELTVEVQIDEARCHVGAWCADGSPVAADGRAGGDPIDDEPFFDQQRRLLGRAGLGIDQSSATQGELRHPLLPIVLAIRVLANRGGR